MNVNVDPFKIYGICLVKNEADVIQQSLKAALRWCDYIYVYDNGSTDNTWEYVNSLAKENSKIIPFKKEAKPFHNGLRSEVFNCYRDDVADGDWWCILDADEFYIDDPRLFLAKVNAPYSTVWSASFQYYFTDKDWERYQRNPDAFADNVSVEDKLRYYINNWSERRFFRHHSRLEWKEDQGSPRNMGAVYPVRIWLKHYQYRSPKQIQRRLFVRTEVREIFVHEAQREWKKTVLNTSLTSKKTTMPRSESPNWKDRIMSADDLCYDAQNMKYVVREDLMPALPFNFKNRVLDIFSKMIKRLRNH